MTTQKDVESLTSAVSNLLYSDHRVDHLSDAGFEIVGEGFETVDGKFYKVIVAVEEAPHPGPDKE